MAAAPPDSRLPRWLVLASDPLAGILMTAFFVFFGFPYDQLAVRLSDQAERSMQLRLRIGELAPHFGLAGPGLAARDVLAGRVGGRSVRIDELVLRPAWSLAWFRGTPALHIDFSGEIGRAAGVVMLGERGGIDGSFEGVRLEALPIEMPDAFQVDGILDATVDLQRAAPDARDELVGTIEFDLRQGSVRTTELPVGVPFERLHGQLLFGGDAYLTVSEVRLEGPMVAGTIEGHVGHGGSPERRPLSLEIAYEVRDAGLADLLGSIGSRGGDGLSHLSVTGTLAQPVVR